MSLIWWNTAVRSEQQAVCDQGDMEIAIEEVGVKFLNFAFCVVWAGVEQSTKTKTAQTSLQQGLQLVMSNAHTVERLELIVV